MRSSPAMRALASGLLRAKPVSTTTTAAAAQISRQCDVFINHRGIDTKRTVAGLLYHHLRGFGLSPFLDSKSMRPGDRLYEKIDPAIRNCRVAVAVFSPRYCESYFCLHELALMMESRKRVVPIFCDVKPSELHVPENGTRTAADLQRYRRALEDAKLIVGLTFDTSKGDWSEFLESATEAVADAMIDADAEEDRLHSRL